MSLAPVADTAALTAMAVAGIPNGVRADTYSYGGARWTLQPTQALVADMVVAASDGRTWVRGGPANPYAALFGSDGAGNWCINPAAGNNEMGIGTMASPLKTWNEVVARLGSSDPVYPYGQGVTVHLANSQPANTDPIYFAPKLSGGAQAILIGSLIPIATAFAAGTVTAKVRGGPGTLLQIANMPAGTAANQLVYNSTRNSYAFIDSMIGSTAVMQQPLTAASIAIPATGLPAGVKDDTWTTRKYNSHLCVA